MTSKGRRKQAEPPAAQEYRRTAFRLGCPQARSSGKALESGQRLRTGNTLSTAVESRVEETLSPAQRHFPPAGYSAKSSLRALADAGILALPSSEERSWPTAWNTLSS